MANTVEIKRNSGVTRTEAFEKKKLATHALNVGYLCGHGCLYCSTPVSARYSSRKIERSTTHTAAKTFELGIAVVDPDTPLWVAASLKDVTANDTVMFCTLTDGWSPEAQQHQLGRRCLQELFQHSSCKVRILTKNAAVLNDFDLIVQYKDRVQLGLSITAPRYNSYQANIIEPRASTIEKRWDVIKEAHRLGIPIYGMLCPCMPGLVDDDQDFESMLAEILLYDPKAIWTEPVNPRGSGLKLVQEEFDIYGFTDEAQKVNFIRKETNFDIYELKFLQIVDRISRKLNCVHLMRILIYRPNGFYKMNIPGILYV